MEHRYSDIHFKAVVIGVSTGGVKALKFIFNALPAAFPLPILVVSHILPEADNGLALLLDAISPLTVKEPDEGEKLIPSTVYLAPPNYHMLVDDAGCVALSVDPPVNYARPSVDVLFESASLVYAAALIGVVLTGAGSDGAHGLAAIKEAGGLVIVQEPDDAEISGMPRSAINAVKADYVCCLNDIPQLLQKLAGKL